MYSATQLPTHLNTGTTRLKLGRTLLRQQRYAESETELLVDDLVTLYNATHR